MVTNKFSDNVATPERDTPHRPRSEDFPGRHLISDRTTGEWWRNLMKASALKNLGCFIIRCILAWTTNDVGAQDVEALNDRAPTAHVRPFRADDPSSSDGVEPGGIESSCAGMSDHMNMRLSFNRRGIEHEAFARPGKPLGEIVWRELQRHATR